MAKRTSNLTGDGPRRVGQTVTSMQEIPRSAPMRHAAQGSIVSGFPRNLEIKSRSSRTAARSGRRSSRKMY